jgi:hypothetical protein
MTIQLIDLNQIRHEQQGNQVAPSQQPFFEVLDALNPAVYESLRQTAGHDVANIASASITGGVAGATGYEGSYGMSTMGAMGTTGFPDGGVGTGGVPYYDGAPGGATPVGATGDVNSDFINQASLMREFQSFNLKMLQLQSMIQSESRDWQVRSQILKVKHDTSVMQIRNMT